MNKVLLGLLLGALLGAIDGATAWFTPAVRVQLAGIIVGSTVKGLIAGVLRASLSRKVNSVPLGILFWCGRLALYWLPGCVYAARLLFRDHLARQHRWHDRRLRHAEVRWPLPQQRRRRGELGFSSFSSVKVFLRKILCRNIS